MFLIYTERYYGISLNPTNTCELKEIQIVDVLGLSNISCVLFYTVVDEKRFLVRMLCLFLGHCISYVLDHIRSYCIRFLAVENVCIHTKNHVSMTLGS